MDPRSGEGLAEELLQRGASAAAIDPVATDGVVGEAPKPRRLPLDPPAGLVSVQNRGFLGLFGHRLLPLGQDRGRASAH